MSQPPNNQIQVRKRNRQALPGQVEIYEEQILERFRLAAVPTKRVKYWGELRDCVSEAQKLKDFHLIRKHEWIQYMQNKAAFKQPVFSFITPSNAIKSGENGAPG